MERKLLSLIIFRAFLFFAFVSVLSLFLSCSSAEVPVTLKSKLSTSETTAITNAGTEDEEALPSESSGLSKEEMEKIAMDKKLMDSAGNENISTDTGQTTNAVPAEELDALPDGKEYTLLIITPYDFISIMNRLAEHKNSTGIPTKLVSLEAVYNTYEGLDEAEQVKRCLVDYQSKSKIKYALLVGDSDRFPVRYTKAECQFEVMKSVGLYFPTLASL
jgi:hypothetical protein